MKTILFTLSALLVIILIIIIFIVLEYLSQSKILKTNPSTVLPTIVPYNNSGSSSSPSLSYDSAKSNKLVDLSKNRKSLSATGQEAKQRIIAGLNNNPGGLITTQNVKINYIPSMDAFTAEVVSTNIAQAKKDAVEFLVSQGFTNQDVCNLPLSFYLNSAVRSSLSGSGTIFNPLPEGC